MGLIVGIVILKVYYELISNNNLLIVFYKR